MYLQGNKITRLWFRMQQDLDGKTTLAYYVRGSSPNYSSVWKTSMGHCSYNRAQQMRSSVGKVSRTLAVVIAAVSYYLRDNFFASQFFPIFMLGYLICWYLMKQLPPHPYL